MAGGAQAPPAFNFPQLSGINTDVRCGPLAHLVEHLICNEGVAGSSPVGSTKAFVHKGEIETRENLEPP